MRDVVRVIIRLDPELRERLNRAARAAGQTPEEFARQTLAARVAKPREKAAASHKPNKKTPAKKTESAYDVLVRMGLHRLRSSKKLPRDLSTNPKYMEGFGL